MYEIIKFLSILIFTVYNFYGKLGLQIQPSGRILYVTNRYL